MRMHGYEGRTSGTHTMAFTPRQYRSHMLLNLGCPPISQIWKKDISDETAAYRLEVLDVHIHQNRSCHRTQEAGNYTLIVTFPFVTFRMLNPTVGIMSSLNCPD